MTRRVFTPIAAASLLLSVATAALWVRSYYRFDCMSLCFASHLEMAVKSERGTATLVLTRFPKANVKTKFEAHTWAYDIVGFRGAWDWTMYRFPVSAIFGSRWGYEEGFFHGTRIFYDRQSEIADMSVPDYKRWFVVPRLWMGAVAFGILPLAYVLHQWARHRPQGRCHTCFYDLTGNTSGTCPECGTAIPKPTNKESPRPA